MNNCAYEGRVLVCQVESVPVVPIAVTPEPRGEVILLVMFVVLLVLWKVLGRVR